MTLYAVCLADNVKDDELISVVETNTKEAALHLHFKKFVKTSKIMKEFIMDLSSDGFYYKYFDGDFDSFKETFIHVPYFIDLMKKASHEWERSTIEHGHVHHDVIQQINELVSDEITLAVADYLIEVDLENWADDAVITEIQIEAV
jgi:deoxyribodipyrimidine photolyase-like uncharacterized protein